LKIKTQFVVGVVTIIIISILSTAFVLLKDTEEILSREIDEKGSIVLNYLEGVVLDPLIKKDTVTLISYIKKVSSTKAIAFITVSDNKGVIVASTNSGEIGRKFRVNYDSINSESGTTTVRHDGALMDIIFFTRDMHITTKDDRIFMGKICVAIDKTYIDRKLMVLYLKTAAIAAGIIILSIIFILFLTDRIVKPLNTLIEGTEKIAAGDMKYKIRVKVKNEFQSLANSFNGMTENLNEYYDGILSAFTMALDQKDKYTPGHSKRIAQLGMALARKINMEPKQVENIRIACILKDIGNIGVEASILGKKDTLSPDDLIKIQKHPEISAKIIKNIHPLAEVVPIIMQHHERYDGLGYPNGLKHDEISAEAKIVAIVDAYDAMITKREHREALSVEEAIYELRLNKGKQFDPDITEAFIELLHKKGGI